MMPMLKLLNVELSYMLIIILGIYLGIMILDVSKLSIQS